MHAEGFQESNQFIDSDKSFYETLSLTKISSPDIE